MHLNDKTTIPLWSVLVSLPVIAGIIGWITFIAHKAEATAERVEKLEQRTQAQYDLLITIKEDVAIIKHELQNRKEKTK